MLLLECNEAKKMAKLTMEALMNRVRFYSACPECNWRSHGEYFGLFMERCYWGDQAKALWRAHTTDGYLYSDNLLGLKTGVKTWVQQREASS